MPSAGIRARKSWLTVTRSAFTATGNVWRKIPDRMTINTDPAGTNFVAELATAASVMWSSVSWMISAFMSFGETHGIAPLAQYSATDLDGVPPPIHEPSCPNGAEIKPLGRKFGSPIDSASGLMRLAPAAIPRGAGGSGRRTGRGRGGGRLGRRNRGRPSNPRA